MSSGVKPALARTVERRPSAPMVSKALIAIGPCGVLAVTPAILPLFVAAGSGAAMFLTFIGFRVFAFRP